ncbi:MAG: hypothetical protein V8Q30_01505 [Acutalibacteraceae bacterium]
MATGTKKTTTKKSTGRRRESAKAREARLRAQRQMRAIILMAVGLLFCALVFLPGEGIWNTAHKAMFGLLGIVAGAQSLCTDPGLSGGRALLGQPVYPLQGAGDPAHPAGGADCGSGTGGRRHCPRK